MSRLKRIVLVLVLLVLPLQATAAVLAPLPCVPKMEHEGSSIHAAAHGGGHARGAGHGAVVVQDDMSGHDHGNSADDGHQSACCQLAASVTPFVPSASPPLDFRSYVSAVVLMAPLHIPELPQRPPKA